MYSNPWKNQRTSPRPHNYCARAYTELRSPDTKPIQIPFRSSLRLVCTYYTTGAREGREAQLVVAEEGKGQEKFQKQFYIKNVEKTRNDQTKKRKQHAQYYCFCGSKSEDQTLISYIQKASCFQTQLFIYAKVQQISLQCILTRLPGFPSTTHWNKWLSK